MTPDRLVFSPLAATCLQDLLSCTPAAQHLRSHRRSFSPRPRLSQKVARRTAGALRHLSGAVRHLQLVEPTAASAEAIAILRRLERDVFRSSPALGIS